LGFEAACDIATFERTAVSSPDLQLDSEHQAYNVRPSSVR
jgi:hypothetical protein